jgi:tetratricopeptide (TPR) repeat protein
MISTNDFTEKIAESSSTRSRQIEVLLADVVFGPYSEEKIRERLAEGLLALNDPARGAGTETWLTLEQALEQLPATEEEPEPPEAPEYTVADPLPEDPADVAEEPAAKSPEDTATVALPAVVSVPMSRFTSPTASAPEPPPETSGTSETQPLPGMTSFRKTSLLRPATAPLPPIAPKSQPILDGRMGKSTRPATGPLPPPPRKTSLLPKSIAGKAAPAGGTKSLGGLRAQIQARTSQESLKLSSPTTGFSRAPLRLPTASQTGPLSSPASAQAKRTVTLLPSATTTAPATPVAPAEPATPAESPKITLPDIPKFKPMTASTKPKTAPLPTPPETTDGESFSWKPKSASLPRVIPGGNILTFSSSVKLPPEPTAAAKKSATEASAPMAAAAPVSTPTASPHSPGRPDWSNEGTSEPEPHVPPAETPEPEPHRTPKTRAISVASFATGMLPQPSALAAPPRTAERPPTVTASAAAPVERPPERPAPAATPTPPAKPAERRPAASQTSSLAVRLPARKSQQLTPLPARGRDERPSLVATVPLAILKPSTEEASPTGTSGKAPAAAPSSSSNRGTFATLASVSTPAAKDAAGKTSVAPLPEGASKEPPPRERASLKSAGLKRPLALVYAGLLVLFLLILVAVALYYVMRAPQSAQKPAATTTVTENPAPAPAEKTPAPSPSPTPAPEATSTPTPAPEAVPPAAAQPTATANPTPPSPTAPPGTDPKITAAISDGLAKQGKGDLAGAIADFTQAITLDPGYAQAYSYRAAARQAKGDLDGALSDDDQLLTLQPKNAGGFCQRGFIKQSKNDPDGAIADYTQAIALDPKAFIAYYNRGLIKEQKGDYDGAITDYNQALELSPRLAGAYYNRGNAKSDKVDYDGAIADYTRALEINPNIALAYCNRALAEQDSGNLDAAFADYNQSLSLDSTLAVAYYNRGLIKEQRNDLDGSIADSTKAIVINPGNAQAYYNRGVALQAKGNLDAAGNDLRKFADLAPKDAYADYAHLYLWVIGNQQNQKAAADKNLSECLESTWNAEPEQLPSKIAGFLLDHVSETDLLALAASTDPKKDMGQHCEVWYFDGIKKLMAGDKAGAIDCFHRCVNTGQKDFCEYILAQAQLQTLAPL